MLFNQNAEQTLTNKSRKRRAKMKKPKPISTKEYEKVIEDLESLLPAARVEAARLQAIYNKAESKVPMQTTTAPNGFTISARPLVGKEGEALKQATDNLAEHHRLVIGSILYDIDRLKEAIRWIAYANHKIEEIKFSKNINQQIAQAQS